MRKALKILFSAALTLSLGTTLFDGTLQKNLAVMANINLWIVLQNFVVVVVVVSAFVGLTTLHPIFKWSWLSLFKSREDKANDREPSGTNISIMPAHVKYFGLLFVLLIIVNLPSLAMIEENLFRSRT